ncbi:putative guanine nucleotide exchange factor (GEF) [Tieghemostelium lacteum]|uniref:Putative guanine nucleotide exchange factor (GEF) n=1 Tax=Tieghemostelium lacteum TaxID=361077 RepID=A0A151Z6R7_TIELA|nr:putative guanine nucleotide exchange factor (GEF) [Tieghemostelium lacteum]|eukprot:KYQ89628.1 putative guanine nucleotide exchange factor (GEF) [Tieghemostelium lacteum]
MHKTNNNNNNNNNNVDSKLLQNNNNNNNINNINNINNSNNVDNDLESLKDYASSLVSIRDRSIVAIDNIYKSQVQQLKQTVFENNHYDESKLISQFFDFAKSKNINLQQPSSLVGFNNPNNGGSLPQPPSSLSSSSSSSNSNINIHKSY